MKRAVSFLDRLSDEQHSSERLAGRWHLLHAGLYGGLMLAYGAAILWHLGAARRHYRDAARSVGPVTKP